MGNLPGLQFSMGSLEEPSVGGLTWEVEVHGRTVWGDFPKLTSSPTPIRVFENPDWECVLIKLPGDSHTRPACG